MSRIRPTPLGRVEFDVVGGGSVDGSIGGVNGGIGGVSGGGGGMDGGIGVGGVGFGGVGFGGGGGGDSGGGGGGGVFLFGILDELRRGEFELVPARDKPSSQQVDCRKA